MLETGLRSPNGSAINNSAKVVAARFRYNLASTALAVLSLTTLAASPTLAQERFTPVHFWAAGHIVNVKTSAVLDGGETFIPVEALAAIGARGTVESDARTVRIRFRNGKTVSVPYLSHNGAALIRLSRVAEAVDGYILKPSRVPGRFTAANTAYLLARIREVRVQGNALHVTTSFPIPFDSRTLGSGAPRGYMDCIGGTVPSNFRLAPIPASEIRVDRVRVGQFTPDTARIVVDLAPGATLERNNTGGRVTSTYTAQLTGGRTVGTTRRPVPANPDAGTRPVEPANGARGYVRPRTDGVARNTDPYPQDYQPAPPTRRSADSAPNNRRPADPNPDDQTDTTSPPRPVRPGSTPAVAAGRAATIRSITYDTQDSQSIQIFIETSRKAKAYVRYSATTRQIIVDIPNSRLNLDDDGQKEQDISHPLIEGLNATTIVNSGKVPPLTRITIDAPRVVSTSVDSENNQIVLEITAAATTRTHPGGKHLAGKLGSKIVVVDAGHGGVLTGAKAKTRGRMVYEKDVTLAIATRLRSALSAKGTRVVMTRMKDVNVPLEDRPRIANEVGANLFLSIHNDSWGKANAITGTTTYFHNQNAESRRLARCVEKQIAAVTGMRNRGVMSDTIMYPGGFCVLRETTMPAVLCEVGYLNNAHDRSKLTNAQFQQRVAEAMCAGVRDYVAGEGRSARRHKKQTPEA